MKYKHLILLLHLLLFSASQSYGSYYPKLNKYEIFDSADFVFIGQILKVNTKSYEIKVLEKFRGNPHALLEGQLGPYSITPESGDLWLVYAQNVKENKIFAVSGNGSKNFEWPIATLNFTFPPPPPIDLSNESPEMFILEQLIKNTAWNELYYEIMSLRHRKMNDEINNSHKEIKGLVIDISNIKTTNNILLVLVSILVIVCAIILFRKI